MQIIVSHRDTIKPSSPTPPNLKILKLSLLDQFAATGLDNRLLLLYSSQGDVHQFKSKNMSHQLRKSLSDALTEFYPLAGRFSSADQSIDCNDGGVDYIEARVRAPYALDQLISSPIADELEHFLPPNPTDTEGLLAVQVTIFDQCGGTVIGVIQSHAVSDASGLAAFMSSWATIARGGKIVSPKFGFAHLIPPRDLFANIYDGDPDLNHGSSDGRPIQKILKPAQKLTTKRFIFTKTNIAGLMTSCADQSPTRVQVVCALIFKCLISVVRSNSSKPILLSMPVDWRQRMSPPIPSNYVGNLTSSSTVDVGETQTFEGLVGLVSKISRKFDRHYLKSMLADDGVLLFNTIQQDMRDYMRNDAHAFLISSCCAIPLYEIDFGWGTPAWAPFYVHVENLVTLLSSKNGDEIEAWVTLIDENMLKFDSAVNKGILNHAHILAKI